MRFRLQTWKKEVWDGSSPVLPGGTTTSIGATRPTRAGAPTCLNKLEGWGALEKVTTHLNGNKINYQTTICLFSRLKKL